MEDINYNDMHGTPVTQLKKKKKYNINQLARNIELNLQKKNYEENESSDSENNYPIQHKQHKNKLKKNKWNNIPFIYNFKDYDIIIITIIFLLLNVNYSINFLNDYLIYIKKLDITYINLIIRSIIFGVIYYLIKKII